MGYLHVAENGLNLSLGEERMDCKEGPTLAGHNGLISQVYMFSKYLSVLKELINSLNMNGCMGVI